MRRLLIALMAVAAWLAASPGHAQDAVPPNILLVIADDMGLDASPCYALGEEKPNMPVLESLCRQGLVFDNLWAEPICSPTRATILTGRYGFRTGVLYPAQRSGGGIGTDEVSLQAFIDKHEPDRYAHAVIGKWHLSDEENGLADNPGLMGVGFYSGFLWGQLESYYDFPLTTDGATSQVKGYATTVFTDIAIEWLAKQSGPWFLWLAYTAPHTPYHVPPAGLHDRKLVDDRKAIRADPLPYYLAALEALDHELGRLLDTLSPDVRANTVVIFVGDNGTPAEVAQLPYARDTVKGSLYPGGVRVPMIISGAGVTRKGEREAALVNTTDLFATIAELTGVKAKPPADSISFKALLSAPSAGSRGFTYSDMQGNEPPPVYLNSGWTVGDGRHQFMRKERGAPRLFLFDTKNDPGGAVNLLESGSPEADAVAARLRAQIENLHGRR